MDEIVVGSYTNKPREIAFDDVIPDSFGDFVYKYVCQSKAK